MPVDEIVVMPLDEKVKERTKCVDEMGRGASSASGDAMDHDPETCRICLRNDRVRFDAETGSHYVPHDSEAAFPLFRLYPIVAER